MNNSVGICDRSLGLRNILVLHVQIDICLQWIILCCRGNAQKEHSSQIAWLVGLQARFSGPSSGFWGC